MSDLSHYRYFQLAQRYGIPDQHVRELLIQWANHGLIWLACWDGTGERPWHQWPDPDQMFFNTTDHGYVRVRLLAEGAALVEDIPAHRIGFVSA